ncbi:MAG TPA: DNA translocase FtsK, partial [Chitinophagaceae bacterium]
RISRIKNLEDDIALSLAALGIRIIAPIPGKGTIGIEVPNVKKSIVSMKTLLSSDKFQHSKMSLPIAIGKRIDNENFIVDLATMPHLLMAGATGQGKSVGINALLLSLLYKKHPSQLKFVLVDPKKVELSIYKTIEKHFLAKLPGEEEAIITDTKKVVHTLNALCIEMDNRYDLLKEAGSRNIREYNEKFIHRKLNPVKGHQYLPFIVLVIDEFADLIMTAGKEIEMPIARLAQLARAVGIHLIIATQRPSVNIITGTIKANFPARIAFKVSSKVDSRTILDTGGAEQLIGKGDMLISYNGELVRLQCAFVDTPEVDRVVDFIAGQRGYPEAFLLPEYVDEKELEGRDFNAGEKDPLFEEAAKIIVQAQQGSTSLLQRRMKLGYNRAGRLMDQLEGAGIVGPNMGSKAREVLIKTDAELEQQLQHLF